MLWGLWIWTRYESPYKRFNDEDVPFKPFTISQEQILENFLELETSISEESASVFYSLFYFAETVNGYIDYYKSTYKEDMYLESSGGYGQMGINLSTEYRPSSGLYEVTKILSNLIDDKKVDLFFQDKSEYESWSIFYTTESNIRQEYRKLEQHILELVNKDSDFVPKEEHFNFTASSLLNNWLLVHDEEQVPNKYVAMVQQLQELTNKISEVQKSYKREKNVMIENIDSPRFSIELKKLIEELEACTEVNDDVC